MKLEAAAIDVLARVAETGSLTTVPHAVRRYDPFLRPAIRRRVDRSIRAAQGHAPDADEQTQLSFALLHSLGKPWPESNYRQDSQAQLDALIEAHAKRRWGFWPLTSALLLTLLGLAAVSIWIAIRPTPEESFLRSPLALSMDDPLTNWVVAVGGDESAEEHDAEALLLSPGVERQLGKASVDKLKRVLKSAKALRNAEDIEPASKLLQSQIGELDASLTASGIPAHFDAYYEGWRPRRAVWLTGYYVADRYEVEHAGKRWPIVVGARLDHLNLRSPTALRRGADRELLVSLDRAEERLLSLYLPACASDLEVAQTRNTRSPLPAIVVKALGASIGPELRAEAHVDAGAMLRLREASDARDWELEQLSSGSLTPIRTLRLTGNLARRIDRSAETNLHASGLRREQGRLEHELPAARRVAGVLARLHAEAFVRQLEQEAHPLTASPELTARLGGPGTAIRAELALSMLATNACCAGVLIDELARDAFVDAVVVEELVIDALDVELGGRPRIEAEGRAELAERIVRLLQRPREALRAAASKVHLRWFGVAPLPYARR